MDNATKFANIMLKKVGKSKLIPVKIKQTSIEEEKDESDDLEPESKGSVMRDSCKSLASKTSSDEMERKINIDEDSVSESEDSFCSPDDVAPINGFNATKKNLDKRFNTVNLDIHTHKGKDADLLEHPVKQVHEVTLHHKMLILFATNLIQCNQFEAAVKVLEEIGMEACTETLAQANIFKLMCLTLVKEGAESLYTAIGYCEQAQEKFKSIESIKGHASTLLLELHILLKLRQMQPGSDFDIHPEDSIRDKNVSRIYQTIASFKRKMNQLQA